MAVREDLDILAGLSSLVKTNLSDIANASTSNADKNTFFKKGIIDPKRIIMDATSGGQVTPSHIIYPQHPPNLGYEDGDIREEPQQMEFPFCEDFLLKEKNLNAFRMIINSFNSRMHKIEEVLNEIRGMILDINRQIEDGGE